eukprot:34911_1
MCTFLWMMLFIQCICSKEFKCSNDIVPKKCKYNITYQNIGTKCDDKCKQLAEFSICKKKNDPSTILVHCKSTTDETDSEPFIAIEKGGNNMDNSDSLFTATVIVDTTFVILALLVICMCNLHPTESSFYTYCPVGCAALVTCIIYLMSFVLMGMSMEGTDGEYIKEVKKMDCFRYDDTDLIHQMTQDSKRLAPFFGLGLTFALSSIIYCVVQCNCLAYGCNPKNNLCTVISTVCMILAAVINICLAYWYMDLSNHSTFSHDWQLVLDSITDPQPNSTIQSCYAEGAGLPDSYFVNMSYPSVSNPTPYPTKLYPTYAVPTRTMYPTTAIPTDPKVTMNPTMFNTQSETEEPSLNPPENTNYTTNSPTIYVTSPPTVEPTTMHPSGTPTLAPLEQTIAPSFDPTFRPTDTPTEATFAPTFNPTVEPTSPLIENVELAKECDFENRYCYDFALAQVDATKDVNCNEICENSNRIYKGVEVLFRVNLTNSIFEMLAFVVDLLLLIPWEKYERRMSIFWALFASQIVLVFVDCVLEIASGSIVIDYELVDHLDELFANQCYSRYGDSTIIEMSSNVEQILYLSWCEAILSICVLWFCYIKIKHFKDDMENKVPLTRKSFFISLFASLINLILACLTFFVFTMPTYLDYIQLYDSEQMSCWITK